MKEKKLGLSSSSGSGYNFEHIIETELILDLYYELEYFGNNYFPSSTLDKMIFQGRNLGYKNDDFIIKCDEKTLLFQITEEKISYTSKPSKFSEFIKNAYDDYKKDEKAVSILVKSNELVSKDKQIIKFLDYIKTSTFNAYQNVTKSKEENNFLWVINDILSEYKLSSEEVYNFVKSIYIINKNNKDLSNEYKVIIKNNKKGDNYNTIVSLIKDFCFKKSINGEEINYIDVYNLLNNYLENNTLFSNILDASNKKLNNILDNINDYKIKREELVKKFKESKKNINIIYGSPGVGKSAFIKSIFNDLDYRYKIYIDAEDIASSKDYLINLKKFIKTEDNIILIIDRCEKLFENDNENFLEFLKENNNLNMIFITREYSLYKLKMLLYDSKYDLTKINYFPVDEVSTKDVLNVLKSNNINIENNKLLELLKNLFYLNNMVKYSQILKLENTLINEFMVKESLFKAITNNNETYKNALISVFEYKYGFNETSYLNFTKEIEYFIKEGILLENHGNYTFTHDKYDDLVLFYILDGKYNNNLEGLLTSKSNLTILRGLNVWFKDKIHVNKKETFKEISRIIKSSSVLILFKNEIIKILFVENLIEEYINYLEVNTFFNDLKVFNLIISSALIIDPINIYIEKKEEIIPNKKYLDVTAGIIASNKAYLNKDHVSSLMKILKGICNYLKLNNELIYSLNDYYIIFTFLLGFTESKRVNYLFKHDFLQIYYYFSVFDTSLAEKHLDRIIASRGNDSTLNNLESQIYSNIVYLHNRVVMPRLYAKTLCDRLCQIIMPKDFFEKEEKDWFKSKNKIENLNYTTKLPYKASSQLYVLILSNPDKTLKYIDEYITKYVNLYKRKTPSYRIFKFEEFKMPFDENHFYALKGKGKSPALIKDILMYVQRYFALTSFENKKTYLNKMLKNVNSLFKLSLIVDIIKSSKEEFFDKLLQICKYKDILTLDLQLTDLDRSGAYNRMIESGMINETNEEKKLSLKSKKSLWFILFEMQYEQKYKYDIWNLFTTLEKSNDKTTLKNLDKYDIRKYTKENKENNIFVSENNLKPTKTFGKKTDGFKEKEKHIQNILDGKIKNDYTVSNLKEMYESFITTDYLFKERYLTLILAIKTPSDKKNKKFQKEAKKILLSKLSDKKLIVVEKDYRKYLLQIIDELYNFSLKSKRIVINYLLSIVKKETYYDETLSIIRSFNKTNKVIYDDLLKTIQKEKWEKETKDIMILKLTDANLLNNYLDEINSLLKYVKREKYSGDEYFFIYKNTLNIISNNIDNKNIREITYKFISENDFHSTFIETIISSLIQLFEREKIDGNLFWQVVNDLSNLILKKIRKGKEFYYICSSTNYFYDDYYLDEARTIRSLLLRYLLLSESKQNVLFDKKGKETYLKIAKKFINLPVGISAFCYFLWRFNNHFDSKYLLEFSSIIGKSSVNENYFNDSDTESKLEILLLDIYHKKLDTLSSVELLSFSEIVMNYVIYTSSYKVNYIYQELLPTIYK